MPAPFALVRTATCSPHGAQRNAGLTRGGQNPDFACAPIRATLAGRVVRHICLQGREVSSDWEWDESSKYRNVDAATVVA